MARLLPDDIPFNDANHHFGGEQTTLLRLKEGLPDQYSIFHGVHWTRTEQNVAIYGEIDFLIVNPYGRILAIEQKDTDIEQDRQGRLVAIYKSRTGNHSKSNIESQVARNIQNLRQEYSRRHQNSNLQIDHLLYLPNAQLKGTLPSNIAIGRVVDASQAQDLCKIILDIFESSPMPQGENLADPLEIIEFCSGKANVTPHIGAIGQLTKKQTTRLSNGLAQWAQRLSFDPFRLWVNGTAGSGKTQLAIAELKRANDNDELAMYICYNRALADAIKPFAPDANNCMTFHELAMWLAKQDSIYFDFSGNDVFKEMSEYLLSHIDLLKEQVDVLIIDEGQDFAPVWGQALLQMVKPHGRALWLEDSSQDLYGRRQAGLPPTDQCQWVRLDSPVNYRSPKCIVDLINDLELSTVDQESGSPYAGIIPAIYFYEDKDLLATTEEAVADLIREDFKPESIAVLSFHGISSSALFCNDLKQLAGHEIRKAIGYDPDGTAQWTTGDLLLETLFRFKGQCADAVVLTEIDFNEWSESARRRLFVGLTRARMKVSLVIQNETGELFGLD